MNRVLKIGIDARVLADPHCGIGRYATNLVREFAALQSQHRVFLYSHRPFQLGFSLPEKWKVRVGAVHKPGLSTAFAQLYFPVWARKDGIDVFWTPRHQLPLLLPPRTRKVLTVHDVAWKRFPETMTRSNHVLEALMMPLSLRIADQVITDSKFSCSEILTFFPGVKSKINVIYLASNLKSEGEMGLCPLSRPYFLFVGSSEPRKNIERMLLAYVQYRKLIPHPIDLVLAGGYQWGNFSATDFIRANDLQSSVHLIQHVDDTVLRALYANAQALVLVSLYEGFGLPLVEAMQWGIPLIASNTSSVGEIAGDAALLVDPNETDEIVQAFRRMTEDEAMRLELSQKSKKRGQQFSWKQAASETMALLCQD
jgi:glycosyltransferase involved in cell wall biosynthesis